MKGAIVGFGAIAMGHMVGYSRISGLSISAVVDVCEQRRRYAERSFGLPAYRDFAELIANERVDFVDICTPPNIHTEYSLLGLAHDLHVLCEKPVFLPGAGGYLGLLEQIRNSDRVFYPCHVYKFAPVLDTLREIIGAPGFGEVLGANFRTLRRGHAVGIPEWRPDWRRETEISYGGILRDHGPHSIYLAMSLTGCTPRAVSCVAGGLRRGRHEGSEDTALVRMRCDDDVEIAFTLSWGAGHRSTGYSIMGTSGSVIVDGDDLTYAVNGNVGRRVIESGFDDPSHQEWFHRMLEDFAAVVADPSRQTELVEEALITSLVIDGAYASAAADGSWIDIRVPSVMLRPSRV